MSKELTPSEIAAALQAMGVEVPEELSERAANEKNDATERYLFEHLSSIENETDRIAAATESREWSEQVAANMLSFDSFEASKPGRGSNKVTRRKIVVDTPAGELTIMLDVPRS